MKNPNPPLASNPSEESGGNFGAGFFLGALSGAAAVLFLQTERGQSLWNQLKQEFKPHIDEFLNNEHVEVISKEVKEAIDEATPVVKANLAKFPKFTAKL